MMTKSNETLSHRTSVPDLLTEKELVHFLRIPEVSTASDHHNVIKNLIRFRDLPRIQICNKLLYPRQAVLEWIMSETIGKKGVDGLKRYGH